MRKSFLMCFTGIDGSGKTSHARSIIRFLGEKGFYCEYVWGAWIPFVSYAILGVTRVLGFWKESKEDAYTDPLEYAPRHVADRIGFLLGISFLVDLQLRTLFKIRLPMLLGKSIVCDRYFYDTIMELIRNGTCSLKFAYLFSKTLPRPTITFLMDVPETLAVQRRGFSFKESGSKRAVFSTLGKTFGLVIVDSSKDFMTNQERIRVLALERIVMKKKNSVKGGVIGQ